MSRRAAGVVIAAAVWTVFIWGFRLWNMLGEGHSLGFVVVHGMIAAISVAFAGALFAIGWRSRRVEERARPVGDAVAAETRSWR